MGEFVTAKDLTSSVATRLVSATHWPDASFLNLPILYPSGSFITVRIERVDGGYRVSDSGFAYREAESFGAGRSFGVTAKGIVRQYDVRAGRRSVYVDVTLDDVDRAVMDVGAASHAIAQRIIDRASDDGEIEISDLLKDRLEQLFDRKALQHKSKIVGASSTEWDVTSIATVDGHAAVFQAVSNQPISVYKASTAFHDLAVLPSPPRCIAVVANKQSMGANLSILSRAGRVIDVHQSDAAFLKAAS